jgi:predicted GIY-YIG superfamily endonuclease
MTGPVGPDNPPPPPGPGRPSHRPPDGKAVTLAASKRHTEWTAITRLRPKHPWARAGQGRPLHRVIGGRAIWDHGELIDYYVRFRCKAETARPHLYWDPPEDTAFCDDCLLWGYGEPMVYQAFDAAGSLVYVGYSSRVDKRLKQHARNSPWWPNVARVELTRFPSDKEALASERALIKQQLPRHNVRSMPRKVEQS